MTDPTQRFTSRVEHYVRYRPSYPRDLLDLLETRCGLSSASVVADVGSGTGILSELFLENGNRVIGIEPNKEMREAAERRLRRHPRFTSVAGTAEATTLDDASADFVAAGQAFHWFDPERARTEFSRILKPGGWVVLAWNLRRKEATPFLPARLRRRPSTTSRSSTSTALRVGYSRSPTCPHKESPAPKRCSERRRRSSTNTTRAAG